MGAFQAEGRKLQILGVRNRELFGELGLRHPLRGKRKRNDNEKGESATS